MSFEGVREADGWWTADRRDGWHRLKAQTHACDELSDGQSSSERKPQKMHRERLAGSSPTPSFLHRGHGVP